MNIAVQMCGSETGKLYDVHLRYIFVLSALLGKVLSSLHTLYHSLNGELPELNNILQKWVKAQLRQQPYHKSTNSQERHVSMKL